MQGTYRIPSMADIWRPTARFALVGRFINWILACGKCLDFGVREQHGRLLGRLRCRSAGTPFGCLGAGHAKNTESPRETGKPLIARKFRVRQPEGLSSEEFSSPPHISTYSFVSVRVPSPEITLAVCGAPIRSCGDQSDVH